MSESMVERVKAGIEAAFDGKFVGVAVRPDHHDIGAPPQTVILAGAVLDIVARAAIAAHLAALSEQGIVVVPRDLYSLPEAEFKRISDAGERAFKEPDNRHGAVLIEVYRGMIAALSETETPPAR